MCNPKRFYTDAAIAPTLKQQQKKLNLLEDIWDISARYI